MTIESITLYLHVLIPSFWYLFHWHPDPTKTIYHNITTHILLFTTIAFLNDIILSTWNSFYQKKRFQTLSRLISSINSILVPFMSLYTMYNPNWWSTTVSIIIGYCTVDLFLMTQDEKMSRDYSMYVHHYMVIGFTFFCYENLEMLGSLMFLSESTNIFLNFTWYKLQIGEKDSQIIVAGKILWVLFLTTRIINYSCVLLYCWYWQMNGMTLGVSILLSMNIFWFYKLTVKVLEATRN